MTRTFALPELAESVVEGEIVTWHVQAGEHVDLDQPLLEVMTDKVTVEIPSPFAGVLLERLVSEGDVVPVGTPIARFSGSHGAGDQETESSADGEGPAAPSDSGTSADDAGDALSLFRAGGPIDDGPLPIVRKPSAPSPADSSVVASPSASPAVASNGLRPLAAPAVRKRARELGVALGDVAGTGPSGRIRMHDLDEVVSSRRSIGDRGRRSEIGPVYRGSPLLPVPDGPEARREPIRGLRRTISKQMMDSHLGTARALHVDEADVTRLVDLRARLKPRAARRGVHLSYLPFVMKALTTSLLAFPNLNSTIDDEADEIVRYRDVHLGMATDTPSGLVVPVIHDASRRTVLDLAFESARLAHAAREGTLAPSDVRGGTITITNIGSVGGLFSFPILHARQAAILGVHAIKKRPVVDADDRVVVRQMLYLSLSFDHRLIDGAEAVRFTSRLIELLEEPEEMLLDA